MISSAPIEKISFGIIAKIVFQILAGLFVLHVILVSFESKASTDISDPILSKPVSPFHMEDSFPESSFSSSIFSENEESVVQTEEDFFSSFSFPFAEKGSWSSCWKDAVGELISSCKDMENNDIDRSRFSISLTRCHLLKSGINIPVCTNNMTVSDCTAPLLRLPVAFNTYTEFFTHSSVICHQVQAEKFQVSLENTVENLHLSGQEAAQKMEALQQKTSHLRNVVESSHDLQKELQDNQAFLIKETQNGFSAVRLQAESIMSTQTELLSSQNILEDGFVELMSSSSILKNMLNQSLAGQAVLLMGVENLQEGHEHLLSAVDTATENQKELLHMQSMFHENQEVHHTTTMAQLGALDATTEAIFVRAKEGLDLTSTLLEQGLALSTVIDSQYEKMDQAHTMINDLVGSVGISIDHTRRFQDELAANMDRLTTFTSSLKGEFHQLKSVFFFIACIISGYFITTLDRVSSARFYVYLICIAELLLEIYTFTPLSRPTIFACDAMAWLHLYTSPPPSGGAAADVCDHTDVVWVVRKTAVVIALGVVGATGLLFQSLSTKLALTQRLISESCQYSKIVALELERTRTLLALSSGIVTKSYSDETEDVEIDDDSEAEYYGRGLNAADGEETSALPSLSLTPLYCPQQPPLSLEMLASLTGIHKHSYTFAGEGRGRCAA